MKILVGILLLMTQSLYPQEFLSKDLIGNWQANKCELFSNGELIKTAYLDNSSGDNKVIEGKYSGKLDDEINSDLKSIIGSVISINEDSTVSWDATTNKLGFNNAFWELKPTGELLICRYENRFRMRPLIFSGRIISISSEGICLIYYESGFELKLLFVKR
jgi:hypothetical protein